MQQGHKFKLAVLQLAALQLFIALVCAPSASAVGLRAPRTHAPTASHTRTPDPSSAQRRRRARRLRRADALSPGVWGGLHIRFEVTEGGARIDLDCAHASVDGKIYVDGAGRFSVTAAYRQEHGGPVREEEEARGEPVRLTGRVGGSLMSLTVTRGRTRVGTYSLTRDNQGRVVKCR